MQTPNSKKKIQFGQTNALSVPAKRTADQSALKIPEKQFGSEVKIPKDKNDDTEGREELLATPSKKDYKLIEKDDEDEEDKSVFIGKHATLFINENGIWTKKSKGGIVTVYVIEERRSKKKKIKHSDSEESSNSPKKDSETVEKLQIIYRDGSVMKKIMLNAVLLTDKKIFQLPQQPNSVGFCAIIEGKLETIGILFKSESNSIENAAAEFLKLAESYK